MAHGEENIGTNVFRTTEDREESLRQYNLLQNTEILENVNKELARLKEESAKYQKELNKRKRQNIAENVACLRV
jgi:hypothetical protein